MARRKKYKVVLAEKERLFLERFVKTGSAKAREILRARILLLTDLSPRGKGKTDPEIAEELDVCLRTVAATRERYVAGGLERALKDLPRSGQPRRLSGKQEAKMVALACSDPPEGHSRWTIRLLADQMVELGIAERVGRETVRQALKKMSLSLG
jgi:transposase